jgi:restriction system protein
MSGRRTKKQQKRLKEGIKSLLFVIAGTSYLYTKSIIQTVVYVGFVFLLVLSILIYQNNKRKRRLRESGIFEIDSMDGIQFEHYLEELYS